MCLIGVAGLVAFTSRNAFTHERDRARAELRAAAQSNADLWDTSSNAGLESLVGTPGLSGGDTTACNDGLAPLKSVTENSHIHVLQPDGTEVCSLRGAFVAPGPIAVGSWLATALDTKQPVLEKPTIDPLTGEPSILGAIAVSADRVVVVVSLTGRPPLTLPTGTDARAVVVTLDASRTLVLATTPHSPVKLGRNTDAVLKKQIGRGGVTAVGPHGGRWIWQEVRTTTDRWPVIAGMPASVALANANSELRQSLAIGAIVLLLLALVGYGLQRRLLRPVAALRVAIEASRAGDSSMRAPTGGPAELASLAGAYNEMIEWRDDMEEGLRHLARHDPLTGLPNRLQIREALEAALADQAQAHRLGVIFVDLDRFKLINDSYGHAVGDLLLRALGARFVESVPPNCTVGRFGGDEFVFVCLGLAGEVEARGLADLVASVMQSPFTISEQKLYVSGSVGIAVAHAGESADDLIRNADTAMYRAKETERGSSALFDTTMRAWAVARLETERELHLAIASDEFELYYQPVCRVADRRPIAAEALIRWNHPRDGLVSPDRFIPVAEETGLILPIGTWVINEACRQVAAWQADGKTAPRVSVNLAAQQLARADLVECFATALETHGVRPDSILAEITESAVLVDTESAVFTLTRLRDMGVRVSVDDFGTGYSSLSYLQRLPIDEVKIDRSFIEHVAYDKGTESIVASIVQLAHALDLEVVAEGVETQGQLNVLARVGCDLAQGYFLGRPAQASTLDELWTAGLGRQTAG